MINIFLDSIADENTKEIFKKITDYLEARVFLSGEWQFVEITLKNSDKLSYPHLLKTRPKDVIVTATSGPGSVVWDLTGSTSTEVKLTAASATMSTPVIVRAFIGVGGV